MVKPRLEEDVLRLGDGPMSAVVRLVKPLRMKGE
jgi:hypothetical protein